MNFIHFVYAALPMIVAPVVLPGLWCWARRDPQKRSLLAQRLGYDPDRRAQGYRGFPKLWLHAVSVGEVKAAELVIDALAAVYPSAAFLLTTTTASGQKEAARRLGDRATLCFAPVDLWTAVARFLDTYQPDALVCLETEIWPNWILKARRSGMKLFFLNGRISNRSIRSYLAIRPLLMSVLEQVDAFSMISDADARRIIALGAPARRVVVNGNVKVDLRTEDHLDDTLDRLRQLFAVTEGTPVFICGSVRSAEVEKLLYVYGRLADQVPNLLFIIAPRHIEKSSMIEQMARARGIACQRRTELGKPGCARTASLVILDTIGELRDVYGVASVVFGGASLAPLGGQNVLEAAAWAKPVLFGPHMDDFVEARTLLQACGGGICIADADELAERAAHLLTHPDEARRIGMLAREAVRSNQGAAARHAQVVSRALPAVTHQQPLYPISRRSQTRDAQP